MVKIPCLSKDELDACAIIIQGRMSSQRFPSKMMSHLASVPLVEYLYKRCALSAVKKVVVATSEDPSDDAIYGHCKKRGIPVIRGELDNVLNRYIEAARGLKAKYVIRVCGDTPFVDISLFELLLYTLIKEDLDYVCASRQSCASGFYSEAITLQALERSAGLTKAKEDMEHVTKFILDNQDKFSTRFIDAGLNPVFLKDIRLTIDFPADLERANVITSRLKDPFNFDSAKIMEIISKTWPS